ncbi:MAG: ATP-binding protein [Pseudomonadota bacterium]
MNFIRRKLSDFISVIFFGSRHHGSYRRFRLVLFFAMIVISLIPVYVTMGLTYSEYRNLLHRDEQEQLRWNALGGKRTVESCVEKCKSVVRFIAMEYSYEELLNQKTVSELFHRIRDEYSGFVDLGVIDTNGIQQAYTGPYRLQGNDYSDQDWYHQVLARRIHISNIFMGYRKTPHFVIAVSTKLPDKEEYWVLRVTIDIKSLEQVISSVVVKDAHDVFLVDGEGLLQTPSHHFGGVLDQYHHFLKPGKDDVVISQERIDGYDILQSVIAIDQTPWMLVVTKKGYAHGEEWKSFSYRFRMIFLGSTLMVLMVIFQIVTILTDRLKSDDQKKQALLNEAEQSSKLASIGRLAAGVAHEINNPLAVINQKAGLMTDLMGMSGDFEYKEKFITSISGIQSAVDRCKKITHRLLGFARRMDVVLEKIDINDLLREVLGFLEKEALYSHIRIDLKLFEGLPMIFSDRGQLQQIFLNILNNAIDAVGREGAVTIRTRVILNGMVQVSIEDTGPGMTPDVLKHIFDPFFTTKETGKGTGLGLSITYGLVKKLGGNIDVESEVGKGAVFYVSLPVSNSSVSKDDNG